MTSPTHFEYNPGDCLECESLTELLKDVPTTDGCELYMPPAPKRPLVDRVAAWWNSPTTRQIMARVEKERALVESAKSKLTDDELDALESEWWDNNYGY